MRALTAAQPTRMLILTVLVTMMVLVGVLVIARQSFGGGPSKSSNLVATSSGIEIRLDSFSLTRDQSDFTFTIQLPEPAISSHDEIVVNVPYSSELLLENVKPHPVGGFGSGSSHQPGMTSAVRTIHLGPIEDPGRDIELTFVRLGFNISDDQGFHLHQVDGEWHFRISSADVEQALRPRDAITVDQTLEAEGVSVMIERLEKGSDGLTVYWAVSPTGAEIHPAGPGLRLIMDDGSVVEQSRMTQQSDIHWPVPPGEAAEFSVTFSVIPARGERVTIVVDPYVTALDASATVEIRDPLGAWSAEPFEAGGDTFEVSAVEVHPQDSRILNIEIANTTPIAEATVMFIGVGTEMPRVYDESGSEYQFLSGSTGMRRLDDGQMGAGTATLTLAIPDGASPSMLTIASSEMGKLLRGPWSIEVEAP